MVTIKLGKKKIKVFNLLVLIIISFGIIYALASLIFMIFSSKLSYKYNVNYDNYKVSTLVTFKNKWSSCYVTEKIKETSDYNIISKSYANDLLNDGYKINGKNTYKRVFKIKGSCKQVMNYYKDVHDPKYSLFTLNGSNNEVIEYGNNYVDPYVKGKINGKDSKDVEIRSNYNGNKIGSYVISYSLKIDKYYTKRLYRLINVVDTVKPELVLSGKSTITLDYGQKYSEPGFSATDNYDGEITNNVKVNNKVNETKPGVYKITYSVSDLSKNKVSAHRTVIINKKNSAVSKIRPDIIQKDGITYVNGIIIVNKEYSLPKDYDPKISKKAYKALKKMQNDALALGLDLSLVSGYRSYQTQKELFEKYVEKDGEELANTYSARPGQSEHQTGLAFDIGRVDKSFYDTPEAKWIDQNAHLYGFIVRYPKDKQDVTGYVYEPWHVRYLGTLIATKVWESKLTLEEYLGLK